MDTPTQTPRGLRQRRTLAIAGAVIVTAVAVTVFATQASGPAPGSPESIRISVKELTDSGINLTFVDSTTVPVGSIVSQSGAEAVARDMPGHVPGTIVNGSRLVNATGVGDRPSGLYWIVSVNRPGGAHMINDTSVALNVDDVIVNANTGKAVQENESTDPSLPAMPDNPVQPQYLPKPPTPTP